MTNSNPPRWAALVLNLILKDRDRESIAGDLLEEYREVILPARGPVRGHLWYLAQIVSLMSAPQQGVFIGLLFGGWVLMLMAVVSMLPANVYGTIVRHTPFDKGLGFGAMLILFAGAGFVAQQRTGEIQTAISAVRLGRSRGWAASWRSSLFLMAVVCARSPSNF